MKTDPGFYERAARYLQARNRCPTTAVNGDPERACRRCQHYHPGALYRDRSEPFPICSQARRGLCKIDDPEFGVGKRDFDTCPRHKPRRT